MYNYSARVIRIVDGDTLDVEVDLGFGIYSRHKVRLAGINCPELNTPAGKLAKDFTRQWLDDLDMLLWHVEIHTEKGHETEKYGRYLATVWKPGEYATSLNDALVANGHAVRED